MRAILISVAILFMSGPMPAQQRKEVIRAQRSVVRWEPQSWIECDRMAARLDAVYRTEEISKTEYDEGMKKYRDGTQIEGVDYFIGGKDKYQRTTVQLYKRAEFIRWYAVEGGRVRMGTADTQCSIELGEKEERYSGIYTLRRLQDAMTVAQAEGLLADVALEGQNAVIRALLESEAARGKVIDRYNKLVENVNTYNKAVNDLVVTVNTATTEPTSSNIAPKLTFN